jgi:hypothetical protein
MTELLLAEPEASIRGFLERQLRSDGFDVLAYPEPTALPRNAQPDVLVLGDPEALDRMRVPDCPVIVLGRGEDAVRALELADDYLQRPRTRSCSRASGPCCAAARRAQTCSRWGRSRSIAAPVACSSTGATSSSRSGSSRCS